MNHRLQPPLLTALRRLVRRAEPGLLSVMVGAAWFLVLYQYRPLVFSNVNWIYNAGGDSLQHYLGWLFYRHSPWSLPLGAILNLTYPLSYPLGANLAYTNSVPLVSIPLKLLAPFLQARFQFIGWWALCNVVLQVFFALLILRRARAGLLPQLLGSSLLVLSPIMLMRAWGHISLHAHWLVLASIYLLLRERDPQAPRWVAWAWPALFGVELLVNPYFMVMSGALFAVALAESFRRERRWQPLAAQALAVGAAVVVLGVLSGTINLAPRMAETWGYGHYSFNLNALFDPLGGRSAWLEERPLAESLQWEGFNYLGAGYALLAVAALAGFAFRPQRRAWLHRNAYLLVAGLVLALLAVTNRVTFDGHLLLTVPLPEQLVQGLSTFRSSGRFFWPVTYLLVLGGMLAVLRAGRWWPIAFLGLALALQFFDLAPMRQEASLFTFQPYHTPLQSPFWEAARNSFRHVVLLPANNGLLKVYEPFAIFAGENQMTLNWIYLSRVDEVALYQQGQQSVTSLAAGEVPDDTLYVFCDLSLVHTIQSQNERGNVAFYRVDGSILGVPIANPATEVLPAETALGAEAVAREGLAAWLRSAGEDAIFVLSGRGAAFAGLDDETRGLLRSFDLQADLAADSGEAYLAVFGPGLSGAPYETHAPGALAVDFHAGVSQEGLTLPFDLQAFSPGNADSRAASLRLNDVEYSANRSGINLAVYHVASGAVVAQGFTRGYAPVCP